MSSCVLHLNFLVLIQSSYVVWKWWVTSLVAMVTKVKDRARVGVGPNYFSTFYKENYPKEW